MTLIQLDNQCPPLPSFNNYKTPAKSYNKPRTTPLAWSRNKEVHDNVLEVTGLTPLVKLSRFAATEQIDPSTTILAKLEFFNPGGSVKDRVAVSLFNAVPTTPGTVLVEASSGNTACGLAVSSAVNNIKAVFTMPNTCSYEKECILRALGSEVLRSDATHPWFMPNSHVALARRAEAGLKKAGKSVAYPDQYQNYLNPRAHYTATAEELMEQTNGKLDFIVMGAGTCGTISGVGSRLKELLPNIKIIAVEPLGSPLYTVKKDDTLRADEALWTSRADHQSLALAGAARPWTVEGIGKNFVPPNLLLELVDEWIQIDDKTSFQTARKMIRTEGILIGGSCGTAMAACLQVAKRAENKGKTFAVIMPDGARNYVSTFLDDGWMYLNGYESISKAPSFSQWHSKYEGVKLRSHLEDIEQVKFVETRAWESRDEAIAKMVTENATHCIYYKCAADEPKCCAGIGAIWSLDDLRQLSMREMTDTPLKREAGKAQAKWKVLDNDATLPEALCTLDEAARVWGGTNKVVVFPSAEHCVARLLSEKVLFTFAKRFVLPSSERERFHAPFSDAHVSDYPITTFEIDV